MAVYRHVQVGFWKDVKVNEEMTPEDKLFYLYLLTNPHTTQIGIYTVTPKRMAFDLGYSIETILNLIKRFENNHRLIKYNHKTREIVILNWGKYNLNRAGKPVEDCVKKELQEVKDKSLLHLVVHKIKNTKIKELFYTCIHDTKTEESVQIKEMVQEKVMDNTLEHQQENDHESVDEILINMLDLNSFTEEEMINETYNESYNDTSTIRDTLRGQKEKEKEKQKEIKDKDQPNGRSNVYPEEFQTFWSYYPRKVGKKRAYCLWNRRIKQQEATPMDLMQSAKHYAEYCTKNNVDHKFVKHPRTFLSDKLDFEDWIKPLSSEPMHTEPKSDFERRMEQDMAFFDHLFNSAEEGIPCSL